MRHFLNTSDLSRLEVGKVLTLATQRPETLGWPLADYGVAMIFEKPSNRTRQSMEMAVVQLGGHPVFTRGEEVGFDVRESVEDITQILAGYHAILAARVLDHSVLERMAATNAVPIVNMLSDFSHPLQCIGDRRQCCISGLGQTYSRVNVLDRGQQAFLLRSQQVRCL